ncbi:hypothetical protein CB1_000056002, partial [Camelus ferus]
MMTGAWNAPPHWVKNEGAISGAAARASTLRAGGEGARMDARTQEPAQSAWGLGWSRVLQGQDPEDGDGLGSGPPPAVASAAAAAGQ